VLIPISRRTRLRVAKPLWFERVPAPQLEMKLAFPLPEVAIPSVPEGYRLRVFEDSDESGLVRLLERSGFTFDRKRLRDALVFCLPKGCFLIEEVSSEMVAASMMARHLSTPENLFRGRIDWLATDPEHRSRGLGQICARSATRRLIEAGYEEIAVTTDDERLGALKIFLSIGFQPVITEDTEKRWRRVYEQTGVKPHGFY
jgi:mycothiol synthase